MRALTVVNYGKSPNILILKCTICGETEEVNMTVLDAIARDKALRAFNNNYAKAHKDEDQPRITKLGDLGL